jgi:GNAT superfamily N-acetyltransferase
MVELASDIALALVALAAAGWVLLFDVLCVGSCTDTPEAGVWSWLALGCAVAGTALLPRARSRRLGRLLLAATIVVAVTTTLAG